MKPTCILLLIPVLLILHSCGKDVPDAKTARKIINIRIGTYGNTLRGVAVSWRNNSEQDSIKWGYTPYLEKGCSPAIRTEDFKEFRFEYIFPTLKPKDTVFFSLYDSQNKNWTETRKFNTASDTASTHFTFTFTGDSRSNLDDWMLVANKIEPSDFTLFLGDITLDGTKGYYWDEWYFHGKALLEKRLLFHTYGNHDKGPYYEKQFALPGNKYYYSFITGNVLFICLNSEAPDDAVQYEWLKNTLEEYKNTTWKLVFYHKPFFTNRMELTEVLGTWWKTFDDYGVDLILNGHTHNYQRTKPINRNVDSSAAVAKYGSGPNEGRCQIIAGGAGAPATDLYMHWYTLKGVITYHYCVAKVQDHSFTIKAIDMKGNVIDSLTLIK